MPTSTAPSTRPASPVRRLRGPAVAAGLLLGLAACGSSGSTAAARATSPVAAPTSSTTTQGSAVAGVSTHRAVALPTASSTFPRPAHIVVVVMENHSYSDIVGSASAPYINSLVAKGTSLTQHHGVTHPSEPNYLALFSGSTHGLTTDACPVNYRTASLGSELIAAHRTFVGYSDGLPYAGDRICRSGSYARKHAPWIDFPYSPYALPASVNQPFTHFPTDYTKLSTVAFVIPNLDHDMHDGTIAQGDAWVHQHLDGYVRWAATHNSMLVLTFDEDDSSESNRIPTVVVGQYVHHKAVTVRTSHFSTLRMIEDLYGLPRLGYSAAAAAIPLP